jgi:hypothetical protein
VAYWPILTIYSRPSVFTYENYRVEVLIYEINISEGTSNDAIPSGSLTTEGLVLDGSLTHCLRDSDLQIERQHHHLQARARGHGHEK